ncbi:17494_t:CDS:10 [Entrophospora sp. SA101]|nr:17494_t:CDS:10 [Entrophospora sp. SA101]
MSSKSDKDTLIDMGFSDKAMKATKGAGLQPAMDWLLSHPDGDIGQQIGESSSSSSSTVKNNEDDDGEIKDGEQTAQSLQCNDSGAAQRHALKSGHVDFSESTTAIKKLTEEEKQAKLNELKKAMADRREARKLAEQEEEINREKIRRKAGKELVEVREKIEERELKKAIEERKKEKEQEKLAKAKIRADIEADKRARAAKITKNVYELVGQQITQPFKLMTTFPRKILDGESREKTLKELNLSPSAALVVNLS